MTRINLTKIIVIVGPTASGKSDLGIEIAKKYNGEIISADSRQVYRGMNIGTGKVSKKEQRTVKHHLLDVVSPKKVFTADDFKKLGEKAIKDITAKGKIPIVAGGTGFYIDILLGRMAAAQVPPDKKLRAELEKQSAEQLFNRLSALDPEYSGKIDRHNKRRLIRALEIVLATGKHIPKPALVTTYKVLWLGVNPGKVVLEKNIKARLKKRLKQGMVNEVKKLLANGISHKRLETFGLEYRWLSRYLKRLVSKKEMEDNLYRDIVKYSKRQLTWFKKNKEINWFKNKKEADNLASTFLKAR